jgi:hypothetical protein
MISMLVPAFAARSASVFSTGRIQPDNLAPLTGSTVPSAISVFTGPGFLRQPAQTPEQSASDAANFITFIPMFLLLFI